MAWDGKKGSYFGNLLSATFSYDFLSEKFPLNHESIAAK